MSKNDNSVLPLTEQEMTLTDNEKPPADELFIRDQSVRTCGGKKAGALQPGRNYKSLGPG